MLGLATSMIEEKPDELTGLLKEKKMTDDEPEAQNYRDLLGNRHVLKIAGARPTLTAHDKFRVIHDGIEYEFEVAEEGGYIAHVPEYPSAISQGETFEEALDNIRIGLVEVLQTARELGLKIPVAGQQDFHGSSCPSCDNCSPDELAELLKENE